MNKILRSFWFFGLMALCLDLGVLIFIFLKPRDDFVEKRPRCERLEVKEVVHNWNYQTEQIHSLVASLENQIKKLANKEKSIMELEGRVNAEKEELEKLSSDLEEFREKIYSEIISIESSEQRRLKSLASTYSSISPESASIVFEEMDEQLVVKILSFMDSESVGRIFETMTQKSSNKNSLLLKVASLSDKLRLISENKK